MNSRNNSVWPTPGRKDIGTGEEGELSAWVEVVKVGGGAGPHGEDDMNESRLGVLCALTSGTCTKRPCALPRAVKMRSHPPPASSLWRFRSSFFAFP